MESLTFIFGSPMWLIGLLLFIGCFAAAEGGYRLGRRETGLGKATSSPKKDHLGRGLITVSQQSLIDLRNSMDLGLPLP